MKKLSNYQPQIGEGKNHENGLQNKIDPKILCELWVVMIEMFGHKFSSAFGDSPNDTWGRVLYGLSAADVGEGLRACIKWKNDFPPDARQFRELAKPRKHKSHQEYLGLPDKKGSKEVAKKHLAEIRKAIGKTPYNLWDNQ